MKWFVCIKKQEGKHKEDIKMNPLENAQGIIKEGAADLNPAVGFTLSQGSIIIVVIIAVIAVLAVIYFAVKSKKNKK